MDSLTPENFLLFAAKHYWSVHYSTQEFNSDLMRVIYIKRLLRKYKRSGVISERLILNHLILLFNVFEPASLVASMLFLKIDEECYSELKTFLTFLNRMPEEFHINNNIVMCSEIAINRDIEILLKDI